MTETKIRTPDAARAYAALDHIITHPELHDQGFWLGPTTECGTVSCFAGRVVLQAGDRKIADDRSMIHSAETGRRRSIQRRAQELLDITDGQVSLLFKGDNDLDDLKALVYDIFGPRP